MSDVGLPYRREAQRLSPDGIRFLDALLFILSQLGHSWLSEGRMLNESIYLRNLPPRLSPRIPGEQRKKTYELGKGQIPV
jgi:hypothetical protein